VARRPNETNAIPRRQGGEERKGRRREPAGNSNRQRTTVGQYLIREKVTDKYDEILRTDSLGEEHFGKHLLGEQQVVDVCFGVPFTGVTSAARQQRRKVPLQTQSVPPTPGSRSAQPSLNPNAAAHSVNGPSLMGPVLTL